MKEMEIMKKIKRLTDLELKIMGILWDHEESMTSHEIAECMEGEKVSPSSVMQAIKRMVEKEAVVVSDHVPVSRVYARAFVPSYSREEFMAAEFNRLKNVISASKKIDVSGIAACLIENTEDEDLELKDMEELSQLIEEKKKKLQ